MDNSPRRVRPTSGRTSETGSVDFAAKARYSHGTGVCRENPTNPVLAPVKSSSSAAPRRRSSAGGGGGPPPPPPAEDLRGPPAPTTTSSRATSSRPLSSTSSSGAGGRGGPARGGGGGGGSFQRVGGAGGLLVTAVERAHRVGGRREGGGAGGGGRALASSKSSSGAGETETPFSEISRVLDGDQPRERTINKSPIVEREHDLFRFANSRDEAHAGVVREVQHETFPHGPAVSSAGASSDLRTSVSLKADEILQRYRTKFGRDGNQQNVVTSSPEDVPADARVAPTTNVENMIVDEKLPASNPWSSSSSTGAACSDAGPDSSRRLCTGLEDMRARIQALHEQYSDASKTADLAAAAADCAAHDACTEPTDAWGAAATPVSADEPPDSAGAGAEKIFRPTNVATSSPAETGCLVGTSGGVFERAAAPQEDSKIRRPKTEKEAVVSSLLHFLDEVDSCNQELLADVRRSGELRASNPKPGTSFFPGGGTASCSSATNGSSSPLRKPSAAVTTFGGLTGCSAPTHRPPHEVVSQNLSLIDLELADKRQTIAALKKALLNQKEFSEEEKDTLKISYENELFTLKQESEAALSRQLVTVDKLLREKTEVTRKVAQMAEEMQGAEKKFLGKLDEVEKEHAKDVARQKQNWVAAERFTFHWISEECRERS